MRFVARHGLPRLALALVLVAALLGMPVVGVTTASAVPTVKQSGSSAQPSAAAKSGAQSAALAAKKAQQAAAQAELAAMRAKMQNQVAEYMAIGRELDRTRAEISELSTQAVQADADYNESRASLSARAVEMYRSEQLGLIAVLFGAQSIDDFLARAHYLVFVSGRDARLLREVRLRRTENMYLQDSLAQREGQLTRLQAQADEQMQQIKADMAAEQTRALAIGSDIVQLLNTPAVAQGVSGGSAPSSSFNPEMVIAETNFRNASSMSAEQIQAFLEQQPGTLAKYSGPDHAGKVKSAAQMIAEASTAWGVSPKVVLATLQKEQSLLSRTSATKESYDWAMGAGKGDSYTAYQYQGFGKQIWFGAYKLRQNADLFKPGAALKIDGSTVHPANPGTFGQYRYTPHFPGVMSFWMIYWRYFGDPLA